MERIVYSHKKKKKIKKNYDYQKKFIENLSKLHTTEKGEQRIKNNLNLSECDVIEYCRKLINSKDCNIKKTSKELVL